MSNSDVGRDVHSEVIHPAFPLPIMASHALQLQGAFLRIVLERLSESWRMTCLNHVNFCLLTISRRDFLGPQ